VPGQLPSGSQWLHEIKHDGFRIIARKTGAQVRLYSRPGNDLTRRFPLIVETLARLRSRSCIIDGEAVACDDNGVALFDLVRHHRANDSVFLYAFDLIELNGDDLRRDPLEVRKATFASIVAKAEPRLAVAPRGQGIGLGEFLEQFRLLFGGQADASIRDGKLDPVASVRHLARPQGDLAFCRELTGIAQQIEQNLLEPHGVRVERAQVLLRIWNGSNARCGPTAHSVARSKNYRMPPPKRSIC
jgi:bifunctional non-homologous end joining protein LigD